MIANEEGKKTDKSPEMVPFIVHEGAMARIERQSRRIFIALVIAILLLFASNALWLYAWMQYDYVGETTTTTKTVDVDAKDGIANYIGNDGDINNGKDKSDSDKN